MPPALNVKHTQNPTYDLHQEYRFAPLSYGMAISHLILIAATTQDLLLQRAYTQPMDSLTVPHPILRTRRHAKMAFSWIQSWMYCIILL